MCKDPENGLAWLENRLQVFFSSELGGKCINEFKLGEKSEEFNYGSSQLSTIDYTLRGVTRWNEWYNREDKMILRRD